MITAMTPPSSPRNQNADPISLALLGLLGAPLLVFAMHHHESESGWGDILCGVLFFTVLWLLVLRARWLKKRAGAGDGGRKPGGEPFRR